MSGVAGGLRAGRRAALTAARRAAGPVAGSVVRVRTAEDRVVLTFDDGPEPGGTDRVLEALAEAGVTATFFVLVGRVRRHRALFDEVVAAGHEVGLHGMDHRPLPELPPGEVAEAMRAGRAELEDAAGCAVRWHRPPYGRQTPRTWRAVTGAGLTPVLWGPTTWDWRNVSHEQRLVKAREGVHPGAILLAHDGFAGPEDGASDDGPAPMLDRGRLMADILAGYAADGLRGCSLGEALDVGTVVREARFQS